MTVGIDVSRLFSDMILACNTRDLVVKKMVYLYLCAYAQSNPDLTLLAINTLQKDWCVCAPRGCACAMRARLPGAACGPSRSALPHLAPPPPTPASTCSRDEDPMIRGLALRSLTGLRLTSILEYVLQPLKAALTDSSGYVRQAGVIGLLKVFSISPESIREGDFVETLYNMLRDRDGQVVVNCIAALNEILAAEGGIAVNQAIVVYLLNRIREFSDWGQCTVMELVSRYRPANDDEMFSIMNLLDGCLKVANSAVVMAACKCFLAFTAELPDIQRQVYLRLKTPMLTLMASSSNEVAYAVLSHVTLVIDRAPGVIDDEFKQFFCKHSEPSSVKTIKIRCLPKLANVSNAREIVAELTEYVSGVDAELARQAVRAIGAIAIRVPPAADVVVESLLELVEMEAEYVRAQTVIVMQGACAETRTRRGAAGRGVRACAARVVQSGCQLAAGAGAHTHSRPPPPSSLRRLAAAVPRPGALGHPLAPPHASAHGHGAGQSGGHLDAGRVWAPHRRRALHPRAADRWPVLRV